MSDKIRKIFAIAAMLAGTILLPATGLAQKQEFSVLDKVFWISLVDRQGNEFIYESNRVPLMPNRACYGWRIRLSEVKGVIRFKEIFSLPTQPDFWGGERNEYSPNTITKDRQTSVTEKFAAPDKGWISNSWCVAEGDPEGHYSMEVSINNKFIERFEFEVIKLPSPPDN